MKSLMMLWQEIALESAIRCCTSATRDISTVAFRTEHEGFSFITITLPTFGKDTRKCLDQGFVDRNSFQGFSWYGGLPRFLGGFLDLVFDRSDGVLLDEPNIDAIQAILQLTLQFSKIALPCSDARERKAMDGYILCEQDIREADRTRSASDWHDFRRVGQLLFRDAFLAMDREIYYDGVSPRHGPGATADKLRGNSKFKQRTWPARLNKQFPLWEMLIPNASFSEALEQVDVLEPGAEIPVRVISVPKTLKTPRIIGVEPTAMQYAQQGVLPIILRHLRSCEAGRMLGFRDQVPNQEMARQGSRDGSLATLDLSEASDRVSNQLVRALLERFPTLSEAVDGSRSRKADVPGHGVVRLAKFASMGSALCFPMEAMVFLTAVFVGIERDLKTPLTAASVRKYRGSVRIYGDDIIVPVEHVQSVVEALSSFGAKVGLDKSFWTGKFRESCGKEYYDGIDVSIVKVRRVFPTQPTHAAEVVSMVSLRNQLYWAGYWKTVRWLDKQVEKVIRHFPYVSPTSSVLGRESVLGYETQKTHATLHSPLVKGWRVKAVIPKDPLDDHYALLKFFLKRSDLPIADRKHLERAGRPQAVDIKLGWASPF